MFHHVLTAIDSNEHDLRVLDAAASVAAGAGARVTVLHVIRRIEGLSAGEARRFYARLEGPARRRLDAAVRRLDAAGLRVTGRLVVGDPAAQILREAQARKADLLVLGSHRVGRTAATGLGTTSYKVGILCRCPVMLVK